VVDGAGLVLALHLGQRHAEGLALRLFLGRHRQVLLQGHAAQVGPHRPGRTHRTQQGQAHRTEAAGGEEQGAQAQRHDGQGDGGVESAAVAVEGGHVVS